MNDFIEAISPKGATITSITLTVFGNLMTVEYLQIVSYIIAILAGIIAIINGLIRLFKTFQKHKP